MIEPTNLAKELLSGHRKISLEVARYRRHRRSPLGWLTSTGMAVASGLGAGIVVGVLAASGIAAAASPFAPSLLP